MLAFLWRVRLNWRNRHHTHMRLNDVMLKTTQTPRRSSWKKAWNGGNVQAPHSHAAKRRHVKNNLNPTKVPKESLGTKEMFKRHGHFSDIPVRGTLLEVLNNFRMDFLGTQLSEPIHLLPKFPDLGVKRVQIKTLNQNHTIYPSNEPFSSVLSDCFF